MRVLIVEGNRAAAAAIRSGLRPFRCSASIATTFDDALHLPLRTAFDAIILESTLPGGSGEELCRAWRAGGMCSPVLMIAARKSVADRVRALEMGADDYVTKPFAIRELAARIRALMRRWPPPPARRRKIANLEVDLATREVRRAGRNIVLTTEEFELLRALVSHGGDVVDRSSIIAHVWAEGRPSAANVLDVLIRRLRRKLDDGFKPKLIHTIRGRGYRLGVEQGDRASARPCAEAKAQRRSTGHHRRR